MSRVFAALLGIGLAVIWIFGLIHGATRWLVWVDAGLVFITIAGLAAAGSTRLEGVTTWPFVTLGLFAAWLFALGTRAPTWLTWLNFGFGCVFLTITATLMLPKVDPVHVHHGHGRGSEDNRP